MKVSKIIDSDLIRFADLIINHREIRQNKNAPKATYPSTGLIVVPVQPRPTARLLKCYFNVRDAIAEEGGTAYFGWSLYDDRSGHYMAQHHAVWKRLDGSMIDVTPNELGYSSILFMADPRVPCDYESLRFPPALNWHSVFDQEFWSGPDGTVSPTYFLLRAEVEDELG